MLHRLRAAAARPFQIDPVVAWTLVIFAIFQLLVMVWDLPGSHGWENDGIAPRDLFGGIAFNLTPGRGHRYPLLHYLIVGLLSLPWLLFGAASSPGWSMQELMPAILSPGVMTGVSVTAKLTSIAMMSASIWTLAKIARRTVSAGAARWTALFAVVNLSLSYYGRTSNLDGPSLFWSVLAMDRLLSVVERGERRDYLWLGALVGAAVATKDQAYACWLLAGPALLIVAPLARPGWWAAGRAHWRGLGWTLLAGVLALAALGGGLWNPTGFVARLGMLAGGNSADWRTYAPGLEGIGANLTDLAAIQDALWWPWPVVALAWAGALLIFVEPDAGGLRRRLWRAVPLLVGLSSLIAFTLVVGRAGHRFVLPLGFALSMYAGVAIDAAARRLGEPLRPAVVAIGAALVTLGLGACVELGLTQAGDARGGVERFLDAMPPDRTVETYGLVVYLPHFHGASGAAPTYRLSRVDRQAIARRNPLYGATEIVGDYMAYAERRPDVIVIPEAFAERFLPDAGASGPRQLSEVIQTHQADADGTRFFTAALSDHLDGYHVALVAEPELPAAARWVGAAPRVIHSCTGRRVWVLVRDGLEPAR